MGEDREEVLWECVGRTVSDRVGMNLAFALNALKVILGTKIDSLLKKKKSNGSFFVLIKLPREAVLWRKAALWVFFPLTFADLSLPSRPGWGRVEDSSE